MSDNDVIVVNDNEKKKKEAKTKFGRFLQKNKINLILILVSLIFIGSVIFTYVRGKSDVKQEGAETAEVVSTSSFLQRNAVNKVDETNTAVEYLMPIYSFNFMYTPLIPDNTIIASWTDGSSLQLVYEETDGELYAYLYDGSSNNSYVVARWGVTGQYIYTLLNLAPCGVVVDTHTYNRTLYTNLVVASTNYGYDKFFNLTYTMNNTSYTTNLYVIQPYTLQQAFEDGVKQGVQNVVDTPTDYDLYTEAQVRVKEDTAYNEGKDYAFSQMNGFNLKTLVFTILEAPSKLLDMFNFEIFGINFKVIVTFLISIALVLFVIGLFKRG